MLKKDIKSEYKAPQVKIVTFLMESGFAGSPWTAGTEGAIHEEPTGFSPNPPSNEGLLSGPSGNFFPDPSF